MYDLSNFDICDFKVFVDLKNNFCMNNNIQINANPKHEYFIQEKQFLLLLKEISR